MKTLIKAYKNNRHHLLDPNTKEIYLEFLIKETNRCINQYPQFINTLNKINREFQMLQCPVNEFQQEIQDLKILVKEEDEIKQRREEAIALYPESRLNRESQDRIRIMIVNELRRFV